MAKHRLLFIFVGVALLAVASLPFLMSASCVTRPQTPGEQKALDNLRSMTRNDVLPSEDVVAGIENQFPRTKPQPSPASFAPESNSTHETSPAQHRYSTPNSSPTTRRFADYALSMRATALEQAGKTQEARAIYQQLMQQHPTSLRARDAALRAADLMMKSRRRRLPCHCF